MWCMQSECGEWGVGGEWGEDLEGVSYYALIQSSPHLVASLRIIGFLGGRLLAWGDLCADRNW